MSFITTILYAIFQITFQSLGYGDSFEDPFGGSTTRISNIGYAFYGGLWAYNGWASLNFVTEEVINPKKVLPIAIIGGMSIVTASYMLMNVAYLTVLTPTEVTSTNAVAVVCSYIINV